MMRSLAKFRLGSFLASGPKPPPEAVTAEAVQWAIRLFLRREPKGKREVEALMRHPDLDSLRRALVQKREFREFQQEVRNDVQREMPRAGESFVAPAFLARPPADPALPWQYEPPSLTAPVSQLCTAGQLEEQAYQDLARAVGIPAVMHRKGWEQAWVLAVAEQSGLLQPGRSALCFGCGRERLPAYFASRGMQVLATDAPQEVIAGQGWDTTGQHSAQRDDLFFPDLISREAFDQRVGFRAVDMNAIPEDLYGRFDVCWSTCSLEHLGSLQHGLDFIENSLKTLRIGGIAIHTTEFNLVSDEETLDNPGLCIYRRQDIERLLSRLVSQGHAVMPLNLHPGDRALDAHIDLPPYALPHLKIAFAGYVATSIGIAVRRQV